jgi:hypothetical protein
MWALHKNTGTYLRCSVERKMSYSMPCPLLGLCEFPAKWEMPMSAVIAFSAGPLFFFLRQPA